MSDRSSESATTHPAEVTHTRPGTDASTEHREQARRGTPSTRNEVEARRPSDGYGPRAHPATRTAPKGE